MLFKGKGVGNLKDFYQRWGNLGKIRGITTPPSAFYYGFAGIQTPGKSSNLLPNACGEFHLLPYIFF